MSQSRKTLGQLIVGGLFIVAAVTASVFVIRTDIPLFARILIDLPLLAVLLTGVTLIQWGLARKES